MGPSAFLILRAPALILWNNTCFLAWLSLRAPPILLRLHNPQTGMDRPGERESGLSSSALLG
jgi:hypothetical protein